MVLMLMWMLVGLLTTSWSCGGVSVPRSRSLVVAEQGHGVDSVHLGHCLFSEELQSPHLWCVREVSHQKCGLGQVDHWVVECGAAYCVEIILKVTRAYGWPPISLHACSGVASADVAPIIPFPSSFFFYLRICWGSVCRELVGGDLVQELIDVVGFISSEIFGVSNHHVDLAIWRRIMGVDVVD